MENRMSRQKKLPVVIVFPPYFRVTWSPFMAPAALVGYLLEHEQPAWSVDLAIRYYRWLARKNGPLDHATKETIWQYAELQKVNDATRQDICILPDILYFLATMHRQRLQAIKDYIVSPNPYVTEDDLLKANLTESSGAHKLNFALCDWSYKDLPDLMNQAMVLNENQFDDPFVAYLESEEKSPLFASILDSLVIGISVTYIDQLLPAIIYARYLKRRPNCPPIVFGGAALTFLLHKKDPFQRLFDSLLKKKIINALVRYEGEEPLLRFSQAIQKEQSLHTVPGIRFLGHNGVIVDTQLQAPLDLDKCPTPVYNKEEIPLYTWQSHPLVLTVQVTRGCYWSKCGFCVYVKQKFPDGKKYTCRSPEHVARDILFLQRAYGVNYFRLATESVPPIWLRSFCEEILRLNIRVKIMTFMRNENANILNADLLLLMKRAGVTQIYFGSESPIERVLNLINKGVNQKNIIDNYYMCNIAGITPVFSWIYDYATLTNDELEESIRFFENHRDAFRRINPSRFRLFSLAPMAGDIEKYPLALKEHSPHNILMETVEGEQRDADFFRKIFPRYIDLNNYFHTIHLRERVENVNFDWHHAKFSFYGALIIKSQYGLNTLEKKDVFFVVVQDSRNFFFDNFPKREPFCFIIEFPIAFEELIELIASRFGNTISFNDFLTGFAKGCLKLNPKFSCEEIEELAVSILRQFVYCGAISHVFGGVYTQFPIEISRHISEKTGIIMTKEADETENILKDYIQYTAKKGLV